MELRLQDKQYLAFDTPATELFYGGAAGGGKSHLLRAGFITWASMIPGLQCYIFRRKFPDLWKNHMEGPTGFPIMLAEWLDAGYCSINASKNYISFWNGAKIHLCHCQHEKDKTDYQGAEIHVLGIDELTTFPDTIYRYLRGRVRLGGLKVPDELRGLFPRIVASGNPGGIGHNWVKAEFIDIQQPYAMKRMPKQEGGMLRQFIPALLEDNPAMFENDPDYEFRLEGLGNPELVRAMRLGDWDIVAGGMFDDVWHRNTHVLKPFEIPAAWKIDRSFDWGSAKPFSVAWWAESDGGEVTLADGRKHTFPRGSVFRIAEWYGWNGKPNEGCKLLSSEIARGIKEREQTMGIWGRCEKGPADSAIWNTDDGDSIADKMALQGIMWTKANKAPGSRAQGWELMRDMFKAALTRSGDPGLYIFENCVQFIRTVPVLTRKDNDMDDIDTNTEDHIADETRYRLLTKSYSTEQVKVVGL